VASIVHSYHYKRWRECGNAFEIRDCTYNTPNRTLSSRCEGKDRRRLQPVSIRGYWSEIVNPPWISFGIKSNEKNLFRIESNQHRWTSVDVSQSNLKQWMWLIAARSGQVSGPLKPFKDFSGKADMKIGKDDKQELSKKEETQNGKQQESSRVRFDFIGKTIPGRVTFICGGLGNKIFRKREMVGKFDLLVFGLFQLCDIGEDTWKLMRRSESSIVLVETVRYLINFNDKEKIEAVENVRKICRGLGWTLEKDVSEPPKVPVGHLDNQMYWLDNEDTLDAYLIWKPLNVKDEETSCDNSAGKKSKSFVE